MSNDNKNSAGVQVLIDRLRNEGVADGQSQAERIVAEARSQAMTIVDEAKREAETLLKQARQESEKTVENGNASLRQASHNAVLRVREGLLNEFRQRLRALVGGALADRKFLQQLILEIAGRVKPQSDKEIAVLLPEEVVAEGSADGDPLAGFVRGLGADALRQGVEFGVTDETQTGVIIKIDADDVQVELTEETISNLLNQYVAPRFRAILEKGD